MADDNDCDLFGHEWRYHGRGVYKCRWCGLVDDKGEDVDGD